MGTPTNYDVGQYTTHYGLYIADFCQFIAPNLYGSITIGTWHRLHGGTCYNIRQWNKVDLLNNVVFEWTFPFFQSTFDTGSSVSRCQHYLSVWCIYCVSTWICDPLAKCSGDLSNVSIHCDRSNIFCWYNQMRIVIFLKPHLLSDSRVSLLVIVSETRRRCPKIFAVASRMGFTSSGGKRIRSDKRIYGPRPKEMRNLSQQSELNVWTFSLEVEIVSRFAASVYNSSICFDNVGICYVSN